MSLFLDGVLDVSTTLPVANLINSSPLELGRTQVQLGLLVSGAENLTWGQSSWENDLKINEAETRTPQMSAFVKLTP